MTYWISIATSVFLGTPSLRDVAGIWKGVWRQSFWSKYNWKMPHSWAPFGDSQYKLACSRFWEPSRKETHFSSSLAKVLGCRQQDGLPTIRRKGSHREDRSSSQNRCKLENQGCQTQKNTKTIWPGHYHSHMSHLISASDLMSIPQMSCLRRRHLNRQAQVQGGLFSN